MAYRSLYNPLSQFVDPGSTEIGEELKNRYLNNFGAVSELETELANFIAAPFESDKKYRNEIVQSTQQTLNNVAERGDYENMTVPVMRSANRYSKESAPIKQNYALYADYVKRLGEAYDEGSIDYEDYQGTLALSNYNYKGIQRDAQGNYSNLYSGLDIITDPKIEERINEALKGIVAEEGSKERQSVGQGPGGQYTIKTEQGFKTVSKARVQQVMDMVMSDPQVREYINRKAQIRYGMADESVLAQERTRQLEGLSALRDQYEQAANETKDKDTKQAYLDAMNSIQARAGKLASMQDPEQLRAALMTSEAARIDELYRRGAEARFSYFSQTKDSRIVSWDQKYLKTLGSSGGSGQDALGIALSAPGQLVESVSPAGTSLYGVRVTQENLRKRRADMSQEGYFDDLGINGVTLEVMESMTEQDFIKAKGGKVLPEERALFNRMKNSVLELQNQEYATQALIKEAMEATGETSEARVARALEADERMPEFVAKVKEKYGVNDETAVAYITSFLNYEHVRDAIAPITRRSPSQVAEYGEDTFDNNLNAWYTGFDRELLANQVHPEGFEEFFNDEIDPEGFWSRFNAKLQEELIMDSPRARIGKRVRNALEQSDQVIDNYIQEASIRQFTPTLTTNLLGMSKTEYDQLNDLFANTTPHANGEAFMSSKTGQLVTFDEYLKEQGFDNPDTKNITSKGKVKFNPAHPGPLGPTLQITYEVGEDRTPVVAHIPMSQIQGSPGIDSYNSSMGMRFMRAANAQKNYGIEDVYVTAILHPNVNMEKPEGMEVGFKVDIDNDRLIVLDASGKETNMVYPLSTSVEYGGYINAQLPTLGFTDIRPGLPR